MNRSGDSKATDPERLDRDMLASRERFIAEHDAQFDFQAGWKDVLERLARRLKAER